ncbi:MAG: beta-ureidopropionase / N-carbamoyl-L-amino-acid hydrolase [Methylobacteriaceae bacterium]|jgi:N-carbamoyl-L-amino-acid hydrolase|nr:beta-ureidopropionase / N-carbamoyl-L-amino-acid hydrolase [Methylobacteriaceae bacterium]
MAELTNLNIDGARLWDSLMEMAKIGGTPKGGCNRLTLTDLDRQARELFARWCEAAGCKMSIDQMGNMFARRAGKDESLPPVMIGSHLDTQPTGGKFDGVLGVLGGLEVLRTLKDLGIATRHPIEVVNWTNEEGSRFAPAMISSGVFAGIYAQDFAYACADHAGATLGGELQRIGFKGDMPVGKRPIHAMFELHIEQGPILEAEGLDIGVVTQGQGQFWYEVRLTGFESHAGTTPMNRRKDALVAAARVITLVHEIGEKHAPLGVGTCGLIESFPNSRNVIPGAVFLTCEFRNPDAERLAEMDRVFRIRLDEIATQSGVDCDLKVVFDSPPIAFDESCVAAVRNAAKRLGYSHRDIVSGAGHDACNIARVAPTAMIFTPCVDGISHNETETISPEWASAGVNVLLQAALEKAEIVSSERG